MSFPLKSFSVKEGYAKKAKTSKGSDKCLGNWQERWFSLVKHELHYYKKRDDNTPKGSIDLRAALVDISPESVTGRPFAIRIAQAKQVFVYIQFNSEDDREQWGVVIRGAAGYDRGSLSFHAEALAAATLAAAAAASTSGREDSALITRLLDMKLWENRSESLCTYPVLLLGAAEDDSPDRCCLSLCHLGCGIIRIVKSEVPLASYTSKQIQSVSYSAKPELRLVDTTGVRELFTTTLVLSLPHLSGKQGHQYTFYVGDRQEAMMLCYTLRDMARQQLDFVRLRNSFPIEQTGYLEYSDNSLSSSYVKRYAVLTDRRIIFFKTGSTAIPTWAIHLDQKIEREGMKVIRVSSSLEQLVLRFESETIRDIWLEKINVVTVKLSSKLQSEFLIADEREKREEEKIKEAQHQERVALQKKKAEEDYRQMTLSSFDKQQDIKAAIAATGISSTYSPPAQREFADVKFSNFPPAASAFGKGEPAYILAWGRNDGGALGNRSSGDTVVPVIVDNLGGKNIRSIAAGDTHSACVTEAGHVYCWGTGRDFQLGCGERLVESKSPYLNTSLLRFGAMKGVVCGKNYTLAISMTGEVFGWGDNTFGQLGLGIGKDKMKKVMYPEAATFFKEKPAMAIAAGETHSLFLLTTGELYVAGQNVSGCLGLASLAPGQLMGEPTECAGINRLGPVLSVACGKNYSAAIVDVSGQKRLFTWGANGEGQLGVGDVRDRNTPSPVSFPLSSPHSVISVSCGLSHSVSLISNESGENTLYTWGAPIANGFREQQSIPTIVQALSYNPSQKSSNPLLCLSGHSATHSSLINTNSQMFAFGAKNSYGELGNGTPGVQALVKVRLNNTIQVVSAACGGGFTLALCRGSPPAQLTAKPVAKGAAPAETQKKTPSSASSPSSAATSLLMEFDDVDGENGPSLDFAAAQIAKLLKFEVDMKSEKNVAVSLGNIEILPTTLDPQLKSRVQSQQQQQQQSSSSASQPAMSPSEALAALSAFTAPTSSVTPQRAPSQQQPISPAASSPPPAAVSSPASSPTSVSSPAAAAGTPKKEKEDKPLPPGWKKVKDEKTGRNYYYHQQTKETTWKRPKVQ